MKPLRATLIPGDAERIQKQLDEARIRIMATRTRCYNSLLASEPFPVSWDDAEAILARMNNTFKDWTGRSIEDHIAARTSGTTDE